MPLQSEQNKDETSNDNENDKNDNDNVININRAAKALHEANYILILAGAGFSADSGLDTYESMPEEYKELCDPIQLVKDYQAFQLRGKQQQQNENETTTTTTSTSTTTFQSRFQQFWLNFAMKYAQCQPHEGYDILNQWLSSSASSSSSFSDEKQQTNETTTTTINASKSLSLIPNLKEWWVYTSNVDGHFRRYSSFQNKNKNNNTNNNDDDNDKIKINNNTICEIHGYAREFRCSNRIGYQKIINHNDNDDNEQQQHLQLQPRQGPLWNFWNQQVVSAANCTEQCNTTIVTIDNDDDEHHPAERIASTTTTTTETSYIQQEEDKETKNKHNNTFSFLTCQHCGLPLRPNVLMFHDTDENVLQTIQYQRQRYQEWEAKMEDNIASVTSSSSSSSSMTFNNNNNNNNNLVILEFGCGKNVPAVRIESEEVLQDCLQRIMFSNNTMKSGSGSGSGSSSQNITQEQQQQQGNEKGCRTTTFTTTKQQDHDNIQKQEYHGNSSTNHNNDNDEEQPDTFTTDHASSATTGSVVLIRVNPKDAQVDDESLQNHVISIYDTSLNAILAMDDALRNIVIQKQ